MSAPDGRQTKRTDLRLVRHCEEGLDERVLHGSPVEHRWLETETLGHDGQARATAAGLSTDVAAAQRSTRPASFTT